MGDDAVLASLSSAPEARPLVYVYWRDITYQYEQAGLRKRRTSGNLLATSAMIGGVACVVLANTYDAEGWTDFHTFPASTVINLKRLKARLGDES